MNRTTLILTDLVFVSVLLLACNNGDLKAYPVILLPIMIAAFVTCVLRHINYYNMTRKIY